MEFEDEWEEYNYYHALCPTCLGNDFDEAQGASFSKPKDNYNRYTCKKCGWSGFQCQLLPEDTKRDTTA